MIKLENLTDLELVNKCLKENCSDCLLELRKRHDGLIIKIINRYNKQLYSLGYGQNEILSDIDLIIWRSIQKYNPQKAAFNTYLGNNTRFHCLNIINSFKEDKEKILDISDEDKHNLSDDSIEELKNKEFNKYTFNILDQLPDKRIKKIFKLRYFSNGKKKMSFKKIGKKLSITGWWASLLFQSGCKLLKEKMLEKNICDKI